MYAETILAIIIVTCIALCGVLIWMCHSSEDQGGNRRLSSNLFYVPMSDGSVENHGHANMSFVPDTPSICVVGVPALSLQPAKIHCTPRPIFVPS